MKKLLLKLLAVGCLMCPAVVRADYSILFLTPNQGLNPVFDVDGVTKLNETFRGQLYVGADANSLSAIGTPASFIAGGGNGFINAGSVDVVSATLNATQGAPNAFYQLKAWNASAGSSFEIASASPGAHVGQSSVIPIALGGTVPGVGGAPGTLVVAQANTFSSFSLSVVPAVIPEPSVLALGLLGGAALMFRRRK